MALRSQGYLTQDNRGHGHDGYWRLRFRLEGHFRTVYLGRDVELLDRVRAELGMLRQRQRARRRLFQFEKQARQGLRAAKKRLIEPLQQLGMHYHGDAIRKRRSNQLVGE
jgi:hypothetical protein